MTRKIFKRLFLLLIVAVMLTPVFSATGCRDGSLTEASAAENAPFYEDRVVSVYLVIAEDDWEYLKQNAMREQYVKADMWYDGELIPDIAVRPKGNSSLMSVANGNSIRFGLKVDLNFFNSARNLDGIKKLNFNNGFSDPTYIREILAFPHPAPLLSICG
jgi:spore coat protein CotH